MYFEESLETGNRNQLASLTGAFSILYSLFGPGTFSVSTSSKSTHGFELLLQDSRALARAGRGVLVLRNMQFAEEQLFYEIDGFHTVYWS